MTQERRLESYGPEGLVEQTPAESSVEVEHKPSGLEEAEPAGPDRVLLTGTEIPFQPSTLVDLRDGSRIPGPDPQGLLCTSPNGRYGLYWYQGVTGRVADRPYGQRVVDLESGAVVLEQITGLQGGQCDWTEDSAKAVISPGGK